MDFERKLVKILEVLYGVKEVGEDIEKDLKRIEPNDKKRTHILDYAKESGYISEFISGGFVLNDKGIEFLNNHKKQESRDRFNKMIAFTGSVLALGAIYRFLDNLILNQIGDFYFWMISIIFFILMLICLGPLISFVINAYKSWILGR